MYYHMTSMHTTPITFTLSKSPLTVCDIPSLYTDIFLAHTSFHKVYFLQLLQFLAKQETSPLHRYIMTRGSFSPEEEQASLDGAVRGDSFRTLGVLLDRMENSVGPKVRRMFKEARATNNDVASRVYEWEEDQELVRWLFNGCKGLNRDKFHSSKSVESLRERLPHLENEFEQLSEKVV